MLTLKQVSTKGYRSLRAIQRDGATWIDGLKLFGEYADDDDED